MMYDGRIIAASHFFQVARLSKKWHDADAREEEALCKYVINKHRCILSVL